MKKALSIILVLVMMLPLLPTAFAAEGIIVYAGEAPVTGTDYFSYDEGEHRTLTIKSEYVTKVDVSSSFGANLTIVLEKTPVGTFCISNGSEGLVVKPQADIENGLRIVKTADKSVSIQFDENTEIGNGLFIQPDGAISFTSKDMLITNGSTVSITLDASSAGSTFNNTIAAVNTTWPLELAKSGPSSAIFNFSIDSKATPNNIVTSAVATRNSNNSAMLTVNSGVNLNAKINLSNSDTLCSAVYADRIEIQSGAAVNAGFNEKINEGTNYAIWCLNDFSNYGSLIALTKSGTDNEAARFKDVNFCGGEMEVEAPNTSNAMAIEGTMTITAPLVKAIAGDSKDAALEIAAPSNKSSYEGKKYVKIEALNKSVSLSEGTISLAVGQTSTLKATTIPTEATIADWTVPTADADKVTLTKNGKECSVKAEKAGTATITVTDSNGNTATCSVAVTDAPASSISLNKTTLSIPLDGIFTLVATTDPASATVSAEGWTKDNDNVSLTKDGKNCTVKGDKVGQSIIKVKDSNNNETSCTVTVTGAAGIDIYDPSSDLYSLGSVGEVVRFRASVTPEWTADNNNDIRWTSSNENVAKVTAIEPHGTGAYIEATGAGSAAITASCGGRADVVSVVVVSDYKFTAPTGKLIWYYDRNPQYNLEFSTSIPYQGIRRVVIQAGNRDYDFTNVAMQNTYGTVTIPYSALYTTFGRQTTTMTVKVFYGPGANDYIYKNLYYRSVYDAPLTADTDMTWAYVTMLVAGLFISASPLILKKAKRRGATQ